MQSYLPPVNFTFDGKHCYRDFGMVWIFTQRPASPQQEDPSITIGGMSGTIRLESEDDEPVYLPMKVSGKLCPMSSPPSQQAAWKRWHEITSWLRAGRCPMIFDADPEKRYMAEVLDEIVWDETQWDEGELSVNFLIQPYAEDVRESRAVASMEASGALLLDVGGNRRTPVSFEIKNTGSANLIACNVDVGVRRVKLSGISVAPGASLQLQMQPPIGAEIHTEAGVIDAMPHATRFDYLRGMGRVAATVILTYDGSGGAVQVTMTGRGRSV